MPTLTNTIEIKATPGDVWAVLADMPATRRWLPGVVAAHLDGDVRICQTADGHEIHEKISEITAGHRSYRFEHLRVPLPVRNSGGTFTVAAGHDPHTATVTLQSTFQPIDPASTGQLTEVIHTAFQQSLESLRRLIETGLTWDAT